MQFIGSRRGAFVVRVLVVLLCTRCSWSLLRAGTVYPAGTPALGARYDSTGNNVEFRIYSSRAERIDVYLYDQPLGADEKHMATLTKDAASSIWSATIPVTTLAGSGITGQVYYGFRAWGPNWKFDSGWTKGSTTGFERDVDAAGNRFNPNKLLLDPYAMELSHDPTNVKQTDGSMYASGPTHRSKDSGRAAPKALVLKPDTTAVGTLPTRPLKDEIIYEVHLRGLTKQDPSVPEAERGTYRGAARKADYLKELGVTAVEFLPVHEFENEKNDITPGKDGDDYWGYATLSYFAPDRRYAQDQSPGGPTREFKEMVKVFHDRDIKVYLDVVYNHTGEGDVHSGATPEVANIFCWRGLDNPTYYELTANNRFYYNNNGVAGNFNCANTVVRNLILDSLQYWSKAMGIDGFRFDLAPVLGNRLERETAEEGFIFDKIPGDNPLNRAVRELPVRAVAGGAGVDLMAEPWNGRGDGGQQQGNFPSGWAEWNDRFRDTFRESQNKLGVATITPGQLATRFAGSRDLYQDDGRKPWHSINGLVQHDGPSLRDLYSYNLDGRRAWDQGGNRALQRQAARNGFLLPLVSLGVPIFTGGDEMYRTQGGDDNPYNIDDETNHLDWSDITTHKNHFTFAKRAIAFRREHRALRPNDYFTGNDHNSNGIKDITWYRENAHEPDNDYWNAADRHFLAYRIDGSEFSDSADSIYIGYNGWKDAVTIKLPIPRSGRAWHRASDTADWMESQANFNEPGHEDRLDSATYEMKRRSMLILIEK